MNLIQRKTRLLLDPRLLEEVGDMFVLSDFKQRAIDNCPLAGLTPPLQECGVGEWSLNPHKKTSRFTLYCQLSTVNCQLFKKPKRLLQLLAIRPFDTSRSEYPSRQETRR